MYVTNENKSGNFRAIAEVDCVSIRRDYRFVRAKNSGEMA